MYYFAYGSNMNREQMNRRCPGAVPIGAAVLRGYRLSERQFADIDRMPGQSVNGLLWRLEAAHLRALDIYEGYPRFYIRYQVAVEFDGQTVDALVYEMTLAAKCDRDGIGYSPAYRAICAAGAAEHRIVTKF